MKQSKLYKVIIIVATALIVGVFAYQLIFKPEQRTNEIIDELVNESKQRAISLEDVDTRYLDRFKGNYEESSLTPKDIDVSQIYSEKEIEEHAIKILSVVNDETREDALYTLPMNIEDARTYFGNSNNMYYGLHTNRAIVNVEYVGKSFGETHNNYSALVLAEVKKYDDGDNFLIRQEILELKYNGLTLTGW